MSPEAWIALIGCALVSCGLLGGAIAYMQAFFHKITAIGANVKAMAEGFLKLERHIEKTTGDVNQLIRAVDGHEFRIAQLEQDETPED